MNHANESFRNRGYQTAAEKISQEPNSSVYRSLHSSKYRPTAPRLLIVTLPSPTLSRLRQVHKLVLLQAIGFQFMYVGRESRLYAPIR